MKISRIGHLAQPRTSSARFPLLAVGRFCRAWVPRLVALLVAVAVLDLVLLNVRPPAIDAIDVGARGDETMVHDAWEPEQDATGATYRWTQPRSTIQVRNLVFLPGAGLVVEIGGVPTAQSKALVFELDPHAQLTVVQAGQPRAYHVMLAHPLRTSGVDVTLATDGQQVEGDKRTLGVRLDDAAIERWDGIVVPGLMALLGQGTLVVCAMLAATRLRAPRAWTWACGLVALVLALWILVHDQLVAAVWLGRVAGAAVAMLALVAVAAPLLDRVLPELGSPATRRLLYAITAIAIFVRLAGVAYPRFGSHDLYLHRVRLADVQIGTLSLWDTPSEFGGRRSIVPSAYYVLTSPAGLVLNGDLAFQWLAAAVDGAGVLLVALLARRLGASERAAVVAAVLAASLPIQYTALWWGFGPQVLGQWLLVLVAVLAADPRPLLRGRWLIATATLAVALLTHPGVVTLGGVWLGALIAVAWASGRRQYAATWAGALATAAAAAVALLYIDPLIAQLRSLGTPARGNPAIDEPTRLRLLWEALASSFRPLGRVGALASILALAWWTRGPARALALAWIGSGLAFLLIDIVTGLQVRYSYFALPMVAIGAGMLLDRLMRTRLGALAGWGVVALVAVTGLTLWYAGVVDAVKPTLTALTH